MHDAWVIVNRRLNKPQFLGQSEHPGILAQDLTEYLLDTGALGMGQNVKHHMCT